MASRVGVSRNEIVVAKLTDKLGDLAEAMRQGGFSHLPILDERDAVVGVFNESAVFDHLWADTETIIARDMTVSEILRHCRLDAGHTEAFRFVRPTTLLDDLTDMFVALETPTTRVGAIFVTASGKSTEALQRMITPWDVLASSST
ncbi:CBS domain-containing protein [Sphingomonas daechungensis]|uniref:CBS domain-containing protein n=1 Tax=Sphingomonas daechungensis TaxID=1176646 RepID=A0ABX6T443_9SPHN|nr:CBS domain-containing protein [Sphingomonas daechungensis]QNP43478.1 CBS domain-containing protein [Sphingomonas daechungensis]